MPWERMFNFGSLGTISRIIGLLVTLVWAFHAFANGIRRTKFIHGLVFFIFMLNLCSVMWTIDREETLDRAGTYFRAFIFVIILWDLFRTPQTIRWALQAFVLGGTIPCIATAKNYLLDIQEEYGRYSTGEDNMNTTAMVIAMTVPLAFYLATSVRFESIPTLKMWTDAYRTHFGKIRSSQFEARQLVALQPLVLSLTRYLLRIFNFSYVFLAVFAICLTGTRFGILMILPVGLYAVVTLLRGNPLVAIFLAPVIACGLIAVFYVLPKNVTSRLASTSNEISSGDLNGRKGAWKIAAITFSDNPVLGTGAGTSNLAAIPYWGHEFSTHNSFLAISAELGVIGFAPVLAMVGISFFYAWNMPRDLSFFWLTAVLVWLLGNMPLTCFHTKPTWLLVGLLTCSYYSTRRQPELHGENVSNQERKEYMLTLR